VIEPYRVIELVETTPPAVVSTGSTTRAGLDGLDHPPDRRGLDRLDTRASPDGGSTTRRS